MKVSNQYIIDSHVFSPVQPVFVFSWSKYKFKMFFFALAVKRSKIQHLNQLNQNFFYPENLFIFSFFFYFFDNISGECNTFSSNTSKYQISKYLELFYRKMVNLSVLFYQYGNRHMLSVPFHMQSHFPLYFFIVCCVCHATITIIS